jgi:hypothetical protein
MDNAGVYDLAVMSIKEARPTPAILSATDNLQGMSSVTLEANFRYGSGGTSCTAIVVTSFDDGETWRQIARFDFDTRSVAKIAIVSALQGGDGVIEYADLGAEGISNGILGDRLAVMLSSAGVYANTLLSVRAAVR